LFKTLNITDSGITIGGTDNRTLTINPSTDLESAKSYYITLASGVPFTVLPNKVPDTLT
jgi:hypothetical protein